MISKRKQSPRARLCPLLAALLAAACSDTTSTTIGVTVSGLDTTVTKLQVTATLGTRPEAAPLQVLTDSLDSFQVVLAKDDTGTLGLSVSGTGDDGCQVMSGSTQVDVPGPGSYSATITVSSDPGCYLAVRKLGSGEGTVTLSDGTAWTFAQPAEVGASCPVNQNAPDTQKKLFTLGTPVTLTAAVSGTPTAHSYFGGWAQSCHDTGTCDVKISSTTTTVDVSFLPTEVCQPSHFCWEQPRPQGLNLRRVFGSSANDVWVAAEAGGVLHWNGSYWLSPHRPAGTLPLNGVWSSSAENVWMVGAQGTVLHLQDDVWACPISLTTVDLHDVWGSGASDIWAVGAAASLFHYDGTTWTQVAAPTGVTQTLFAVSGTSASDVWAAGAGGTLLHYDGTVWSAVAFPTGDDLNAVWASGANTAWVVGANGVSAQVTGTTVKTVTTGVTSALYAVWGSAATDLWTSGQQGTLLHYDTQHGWAAVNPGLSQDLTGIWGSLSSKVWAVGASGALTYWNGVNWQPLAAALTTESFNAVWGPSTQVSGQESSVWAVADHGVVVRWSGFDWVREESLNQVVSVNLRAVWGRSTTDFWLVGDGGVVVHKQAPTPLINAAGTTKDLYALWGNTANELIAVGAEGTLAQYNGSTWSATSLSTAAGTVLRAIWGTAKNNLWIAGDAGTLLRWNGMKEIKAQSGVSGSLKALWGSSDSDIWAVGSAGTILHYDGTQWSADKKSGQVTTNDLLALWGLSSTDVWAAGTLGTLLHWDGNTWSRLEQSFGGSLNGLWGSSNQGVIAVGQAGAILRYR